MNKNTGANLIEYIIPIALIAIAVGLGIYTMIGSGNLTNFITNSANSSVEASQNKMVIGNTADETPLISQQKIVAGQPVVMNDDGSISFNVSGQNIHLPLEMIKLQGSVIGEETSGSAAISKDLVKEIVYMINKYKNEYPGKDVPIEIAFGNGTRTAIETGNKATYEGNASVNTTSIKVGDHVIIYQKDKNWKNDADYPGYYRIEADKQQDNSYKGKVMGNTVNNEVFNGKITISASDFSSSGSSLNIQNALFDNIKINGKLAITADYTWDFTFDTPENFFTLSN